MTATPLSSLQHPETSFQGNTPDKLFLGQINRAVTYVFKQTDTVDKLQI